MVTDAVDVATIGIGAGPACDGQVLVFHDLLGLEDRAASEVRAAVCLTARRRDRCSGDYAEDVRAGRFPGAAESYHLPSDVSDTLGLYGSTGV